MRVKFPFKLIGLVSTLAVLVLCLIFLQRNFHQTVSILGFEPIQHSRLEVLNSPFPKTIIHLPSANYSNQLPPGGQGKIVYFLEISGSSKIYPRQACAIESAAIYSGLKPVVFMISKTIDLSDNTTAQIYSRDDVTFLTLDPVEIVKDLPIYEVTTKILRKKCAHKASWLNDLIRVAILYKFGGLYSDMDVLFLKRLDHLQNGVFIEQKIFDQYEVIQFAILPFESGSKFLWLLMETQAQKQDGTSKTNFGPKSLFVAYKKYKSLKNAGYTVNEYNSEMVYPSKTGLMSITSNPLLFPKKQVSDDYWKKVIGNASTIHFLANTSKNIKVNKLAKNDAYSVYAPKFCPNSFDSANIF